MDKEKVVVVIGGAQGIGKAICETFSARGATVCSIDIIDTQGNSSFTGDIADDAVLRAFSSKVIAEHGGVDYLINNARLSRGGLNTCSYEDFNYVLRVGLAAPFYLASSSAIISGRRPALSTYPPPSSDEPG